MALEIRCPYYLYENFLKLKCENGDVKKFDERKKLIEFEHRYCCRNWNDCENAKKLNEYYERKEKMKNERLFRSMQERFLCQKKALEKEVNIKEQKAKTSYEKSRKEIKTGNGTKTIQQQIIKTSSKGEVWQMLYPTGIRKSTRSN